MDAERVVSVNVGAIRPHPNAPSTSTGIIKAPSDCPLMLDVEGFEGDGQANRRVHGGPHMAAYVYSADDYAWWETELERPLSPGTFGENLTITGFRDADVRSGDRFQVGEAMLEASIPRIPCATFAMHMGDPGFVKRFAQAGRLGFYCRVVTPGAVGPGDPFERVARGAVPAATMAELGRLHISARTELDGLRAVAEAAPTLHPRWVSWIEERLARVDESRH